MSDSAAPEISTLKQEVIDLRRQLEEKENQLFAEEVKAKEGKEGGEKNEKKNKKKKKDKQNELELLPVRGTRDFPPEEMRMRTWLFGEFRKVAKQFGFEEYDAPMLESVELYTRKAGEEIVDQMYSFTTKEGNKVTLRPEMTPSLARLVMQKGKALLLPIKWFSIPQCWRFEACVRGRRREHFQWNMDILGVPEITAEAELIAASICFLQNIGLTSADVGFKINSRKLLQTVLDKAGVPASKFAEVCIVVDKLDKIGEDEVRKQLLNLEVANEVCDTILKTLQIKTLDEMEAQVGKSAVVDELQKLFDLLKAYGFEDWVQLDAGVVRGLAYYTGVVFECFDRAGELRAICGGGRYDNLLKETYKYNTQVPACGFGFGDCVIVELLKDKKILPDFTNRDVQDLVAPFNEEMRPAAVSVLQKLRAQGRSADIYLRKGDLKKVYSYADRISADRVILVGAPEEWKEGKVVVKDLRAEKEEGYKGDVVPVDELV
eukprot:TRINITY_DN734_c1_g3_i1.p1 TRINITY_DN734_c1_g3~~TRINITY_DN734_c1_g3_i1.p1  ORF type:complete len:490 (+),score=153.56 TRINITY_DN734_c1_g3_i1:137-1606(+)